MRFRLREKPKAEVEEKAKENCQIGQATAGQRSCCRKRKPVWRVNAETVSTKQNELTRVTHRKDRDGGELCTV